MFGLASLGLIAWAGKKLYSAKTGFFSAMVLLTSLTFFLISKSIITDSLLFFYFSAALLCWLLGYEGQKRYYYGTYVFCALATLTKGPIGFLLPGLIIFIFLCIARNWSSLKSMKLFSGTLLFLLLTLPWYLVMAMLHGSDFVNVFLGTHNFLRATVSEHPRDNVIYYYTLVLLLGFFPWSGFLPKMIKSYFQSPKWKLPPTKELFLWIWVLVIFVFFQSMATKYITYTYPLIFPLSLLMGKYLSAVKETEKSVYPLIIQLVFYTTILGGCVMVEVKGIAEVDLSWVILLTVCLGLALLAYCINGNNIQKNIIVMAIVAFLFNLLLLKTVCIPLTQERSAKEAAIKVQKKIYDHKVYAYADYPTSAVFYSGRPILRLISDQEEEFFQPHAYSWSSKNIMPYEKLSQLPEKNYSIMVKKQFYSELIDKVEPPKSVEEEKQWYILNY